MDLLKEKHIYGKLLKYLNEPKVKKRFWKRVMIIKDDPNACWVGKNGKQSYGTFALHNLDPERFRSLPCHVVAYLMTRGPLPKDKPLVLHKCDNPCCRRPRHLYVGTHKDNANDMKMRGREYHPSGNRSPRRLHPERWPVETRARGSKHGMHKVIEEDVLRMRKLREEGWTIENIAKEFIHKKVTLGSVESIVKGFCWKTLPLGKASLCGCGCGKRCEKPGYLYIRGHARNKAITV